MLFPQRKGAEITKNSKPEASIQAFAGRLQRANLGCPLPKNPKQIQILLFCHLDFGNSDLFRVLCLDIRISLFFALKHF